MYRRIAAALLLSLPMAGCVSTDYDIPLVDARPNPRPVPGYRVVCDTTLAGYPFYVALSGCRQILGPAEERVTVIRARG